MLNALEVFTTVVVGVMVGVEFSVAFVINPILNALPGDSGQLGRAHGGRMLGAVMPVWYIASLVLVAIWAITGWGEPGTGLLVTAGALLIVSVLMSVLLLVPINNRGKTWTPDNRPDDWSQHRAYNRLQGSPNFADQSGYRGEQAARLARRIGARTVEVPIVAVAARQGCIVVAICLRIRVGDTPILGAAANRERGCD